MRLRTRVCSFVWFTFPSLSSDLQVRFKWSECFPCLLLGEWGKYLLCCFVSISCLSLSVVYLWACAFFVLRQVTGLSSALVSRDSFSLVVKHMLQEVWMVKYKWTCIGLRTGKAIVQDYNNISSFDSRGLAASLCPTMKSFFCSVS